MLNSIAARVRPRRPLLFAGVLGLLAAAALPAAEPMTAFDIATLRAVRDVATSPAGDRIAYLLDVPRDPFEQEDGEAWTELHVAEADGDLRPFVTGAVKVKNLDWRPDGEAISYLAKRAADEYDSLYEIPVAGGESRRVLAHGTDIDGYSWSPDGSRVAFLAEAPRPDKEERDELQKRGFKQEIFEEEWQTVKVWIADLSSEAEEGAEPAEPRALELPGSASELHWSPAGDRIVVALAPTSLIDDEYMRRKIYVIDAASGQITAGLANPGKLGKVAWSPGGGRLAMISGADLNDPLEGRLMVADAGGGELRDLLPGLEGHVSDFAWVDEQTIAFLSDEGVETAFDAVDVATGERRALVPKGAAVWTAVSLSRDGAVAGLIGETPTHPGEVFRWSAGAEAVRQTTSNAWLDERALAAQEVVRYPARDGLEIEGLLIRPLGEKAGERYPLVVVVHGGPEAHFRNGWLTVYSRPGQALAGMGMAVFYPNYRGSTGRGVEFSKTSQGDPAGKEFDDLVDGVDYLIGRGLVDADRVGVTGGSYGGYATAWCSTRYSDRFAAGVMFVGISDKISKLPTSDIPNELYLVHARSWPWEKWDFYLERSPVFHADKGRTPLLILHGTKDPRVYPGQSLELYRHLKLRGKAPVRLVWYPGEKHGNRKAAARLDYTLRAVRWFEHYLLGTGGLPPEVKVRYRPEGLDETPGLPDDEGSTEEEEGAEG